MNRRDRRRAEKFARIVRKVKKGKGKWVTHHPTQPAEEHVCSDGCQH